MELKFIKYLFACYYYQSVWDFFISNKDVWVDFIRNEKYDTIHALLNDINILSKERSGFIFQKLNEYGEDASGISFDTEEEAVNFLKDLKGFLENDLKKY
ncbi:MAG: hypothetical protein H6Q20_2073 [Bacteroidetes bacterium]|nr:hypothetical protein [Bacteroidota bacterium]